MKEKKKKHLYLPKLQSAPVFAESKNVCCGNSTNSPTFCISCLCPELKLVFFLVDLARVPRETSRSLLIVQQVEEAMLLNEITCNLFYTSDQSAVGVAESKVRIYRPNKPNSSNASQISPATLFGHRGKKNTKQKQKIF